MNRKTIEVVGAIIVKEQRLFIAQRKNHGFNHGKWEFPGGKVEVGESEQDALAREISEELNWSVCVGDKLMTSRVDEDSKTIVLHFYFAELLDFEKEPVLNDHFGYEWVAVQELLNYQFPAADMPVVEKLQLLKSKGKLRL